MFAIIILALCFGGAVGTSLAAKHGRYWWLALTIPLTLTPVALYGAILVSCYSGRPCP